VAQGNLGLGGAGFAYCDSPCDSCFGSEHCEASPVHEDVSDTSLRGNGMPKFLIEREFHGAGALSAQQLQGISDKSCSVLRSLGPQVQWVYSYVTDNKIYCVYIAPNEEVVREHACLGGFPANRVSEIRTTIDPTTAEKP